MGEIILAIILLFLSIGLFIISFRSFKEKGFLFNNAYIFASKSERNNMNRKPYYLQSAVVFLLLGIVFLLNMADVIFRVNWLSYLGIAVVVITVVYAIVSAIVIEMKKK